MPKVTNWAQRTSPYSRVHDLHTADSLLKILTIKNKEDKMCRE